MTLLRGAEVGAVQQALVTGQVINSLTEEAITSSLHVELAIRYPEDIEFRPFPAPIHLLSSGYFVIAGSPIRLLPLNLASTDIVEFRFSIAATGFTPLEDIVEISAANITPAITDTILAGHSLQTSLVTAPIIQRTLALTPLAVGLIGVVIEDNDPDSPLSGVDIQVISPETSATVTSNTQGRYRIDSLPIAQSITLQVEQDGESSTLNHVIDYSTAFNSRIISLNV